MVVKGAPLILVTGWGRSWTARGLVGVARLHGAAATLIDGERDLDRTLLDGHGTIGLTAGASTPEEPVPAVGSRLAAAGDGALAESGGARGDAPFRLAPGGAARGPPTRPAWTR